ncbi:MAG: insulinase family protein, partial [Oscillospiraceae bacterium]|nr:insulinase family protein [Oscillospiraceae bacterium]
MDLDFNRSLISDGIYFTEIRNKKFKNNRISVTLAAPLSEETAASYAVLPFILRKGFRSCPDAAQFSRLLSSLYGANCDYDIRKAGDIQLLTLSISAIDDRFSLEGENITAEISKILCSLLLDPVIEGGAFSKKTFETEKQALIDSIKAELNDKISLAKAKCQQLMFEGHPAAMSKYGTLESAKALDRRDVFDAYNTLLKKARIEIMFTGSGDAASAKEIFTSSFLSSAEREKPFEISSCIKSPAREIRQFTERYSITQSKLSLGFTCSTKIGDEDEAAMKAMSVILGGAPFSKLFLNVREKLSLCYYCSA